MNKSQSNTVQLGDAHQIFISYCHVDIQFALQLKGELERCGYIAWLDTTSIPGGDIWLEQISQGIDEAFAMISIVSKDAHESKWMRREYLYADEQGKDILPVIIDESTCPFYMIDRHAITYSGDFNRSFLSIKEMMDRWASSAAQAVVSQKASRSTSASAHANVSLSPSQEKPSTHVLSQRAYDTPQDGHFCGDIATSEQHTGWEDTSRNEPFYGRTTELLTLKRWILDNQCRVIAILGMGGMGKTSISVALVDQVKASFSHIFWRSLRNAPPFRNVLQECVQYISDLQRTDLPESVNDQILLLLDYLRQRRCLIVLDNMETIMQAGDRAGEYRQGYEAYGRLLELVGREKHQSCLLLTSREKPKDIAYLEGGASPVRSYPLKGLQPTDGQKILKEKRLRGAKDVKESLIRRYVGHPLALKLVSQLIRELFEGDIESFLKEGEVLFGDIRDVLDQQFERLSGIEQELMYWLAIEREPVSLDTFQKDMIGSVTRSEIQEALRSLLRRNLIEAGNHIFLLQNVIMEYMTDRFVDRVCKEIKTETLVLFEQHALLKAQTKEYIRESQRRLVLLPLLQRLLTIFGKEALEQRFQSLLAALRAKHDHHPSYAAGNILNLLIQMGCRLGGYDFSRLVVWQAYLQGVDLPEVNFAHANLATSVFTDSFGGILCVALSQQGDLLAAGTVIGEIRFWHAASGLLLQTWWGHADWVRSVAFSPDGKVIASSSDDQTVRLWEVSSGRCLHTLHGHTDVIYAVAFSPDGKTLASGSEDRTVRLWEVSSGQCKIILEHSHWAYSVAFSPDGKTLASGSEDRTVRLWEVSSGQCLHTLHGHTNHVYSVAFSPDGKILASGSADRTVRLWEMSSGQCLHTLHGHSHWVSSVTLSPDGKTLASGSYDETINVWDRHTGTCLRTLRSNRPYERMNIAHVKGLTEAQKATLRLLGAIEEDVAKTP